MATCTRHSRASARAGQRVCRWYTHIPFGHKETANACSGAVHLSFLPSEFFDGSHGWNPRNRSFARAGRRSWPIPQGFVGYVRRKVDVYDLCLMIDSSAEQE